jgi:acyl-CoA hydrolase
LGSLPALLACAWRPDVLMLGLVQTERGLHFGTEASWMHSASLQATHVLVEANAGLPESGPALPPEVSAVVVATADREPAGIPRALPTPEADAIGVTVAALIESGASVQFGPGAIGEATLRAIDVPVRVDSGIISDPVVDLHRRGLLIGEPTGAYLVGTSTLYDWAAGRSLVHPVEHTHDLGRLSGLPLIAINTALEIDPHGQVNVEAVDGRTIAGIGGHADFALAASRAVGGISVLALPTSRGGRCTLVEQLSCPVSTARSDVDIVVTEAGFSDLRGRSDRERTALIRQLW